MKSRLKKEDNVFINESERWTEGKKEHTQMHLEQTFQKNIVCKNHSLRSFIAIVFYNKENLYRISTFSIQYLTSKYQIIVWDLNKTPLFINIVLFLSR